jgi:glycosyltransferase involved in cell wall biosynthesis
MHIRIIHQYFRIPREGGGLRTWHIAHFLKSRGYDVSVITAGNNKGYREANFDGIKVHYLPIYYSNQLHFFSRIHAFWLFVWKSYRLLRHLPPADLHYILTTPLTTGLIGWALKKKIKVPYVFEVGDLWPQAPKELGVIRNPLLLNLAYRLERLCYFHASALVALSPPISRHLKEHSPDQPVYTVPNMSDTNYFKPEVKDSFIEEKYEVAGKFVVSYLGTFGLANHLDYLIESIQRLPEDLPVRFLLMGDGAQYKHLRQMAGENSYIRFIPSGSIMSVREIMNISDAVYVSYKNVAVLETGSPNKFFDGLAAGKLIIVNFKGWIFDLLQKHSCGVHHDPFDGESLLNLLKEFMNSPEKLKEYQHNAHQLAVNQFSTDKVLPVLLDVIEEVIPSGSAH